MSGKITLFGGLVLVVLGIDAYLITEVPSFTALLPLLFGNVLLLLGLASYNQRVRVPALYSTSLVALIGFVSVAISLPDPLTLLPPDTSGWTGATIIEMALCVLCALVFNVALRYAADERRRQAEQPR